MKEEALHRRLADRYISKTATDEELIVFFQLLLEGKMDKYLSAFFLDSTGVLVDNEQLEALPRRKTRRMKQFPLFARIAAAACVVGALAVAATHFLNNTQNSASQPQATKTPSPRDIPPGGSRATLILGNGTPVILDSLPAGEIAKQGAIVITKPKAGEVLYQSAGSSPAGVPATYNVLKTPRGGQYQVTLPDGTIAFLNAESTLRFPAGFQGAQRIVELEGEAYFQVAKGKSAPFVVRLKNDQSILVLGTRFNVHGYDGEPVTTTLLDGSVKVQVQKRAAVLKPGQEATITESGKLNVISGAATERAVAWKNGFFEFDRADIKTVMKQIERWYDVDVVYAGEATDRQFVGKLPMNTNLSNVLKVLELNKIKFRVEGRKLFVVP